MNEIKIAIRFASMILGIALYVSIALIMIILWAIS